MQLVISDGLNADALNEHLRVLLPRLRRVLAEAGLHVGEADVVVRTAACARAITSANCSTQTSVVHLIGERPGTGLNTLSAYLTYGRDAAGRLRWSPGLDHSLHDGGLRHPPEGQAARRRGRRDSGLRRQDVRRARSGVALGSGFRIR